MTEPKDDIVQATNVRFERDKEDIYLVTDGERQLIGGMAQAFPLSRRGRLISLRDEEGTEVGILDDVRQLDSDSKVVVQEELEKAYFMPRILDIYDIEEERHIVTMDVQTDRGERTFQIRHVRQDLRKIGKKRIVIKDVDGNRYEIKDWTNLPPNAMKMLEDYL